MSDASYQFFLANKLSFLLNQGNQDLSRSAAKLIGFVGIQKEPLRREQVKRTE